MTVRNGVRFGARRGGIEQDLHSARVFDLREVDALRTELAEEAVVVLRDALPDDRDAQPVRGQRRGVVSRAVSRSGRRRGLLNVIDRGGAEGVDLMRGPKMRGELFRKDGWGVYPIGLLQLARELELREGGHGCLERTGCQSAEVRELPAEVRSFGRKFPVVDD